MNITPENAAARIQEMLRGYFIAQCVYVVARLGIADRLSSGDLTAEELATAVDVHPEALYRVLRALASEGVFTELSDRRFSLTPIGRALTSNEDAMGSMRPAALLAGETQYKVWALFKDVVKDENTGFERIFRQPLFKFLGEHPDIRALFNQVMTHKTHWLCDPVIRSVAAKPGETIVDVGGATGSLLHAILRASADTQGVLFDTPRAIDQAAVPPDLAGRLQLLAGDFFQSVPAGHAMVLVSIVHMLQDPQALTLLRNCRANLQGPNARLLIVEQVLGEPNQRESAKWNDLNMMVMTGGRERTFDEYQSLLSQAGFADVTLHDATMDYQIVSARVAPATP